MVWVLCRSGSCRRPRCVWSLVSWSFLCSCWFGRWWFRMLIVCQTVRLLGLCMGAMLGVFLFFFYVMGLGSFLCSWVVRRIGMVLSVDRASSILLLMRFWSPLMSLACIAFVFSMWTYVCPVGVVCFSRIGVQSETPSPHRGARCLSSLSKKLSGWHWYRNRLLYSFCGRFFGIFSRFYALISSNSLEAARRPIVVWFGVCRLGMCSICALLCFGRMIGPVVL
jgi:hypothetical protein